jgi:hypothetical protein
MGLSFESDRNLQVSLLDEINLTDGLVAYYSMDSIDGTILLDNSGSNYSQAIYGAIAGTGVCGNALSFDGVNDYTRTDSNITSGFTALTVSLWIKPTGGAGTYRCAIHKSTDTSIGSSEYWAGISQGNFLTITIGAGNSVGWAAGETTITPVLGTWYFLTATWNGTTVRVYIDGIEVKNYTLTIKTNINYPTRLGASSDGASYQYSGLIDEVRLYNRALSAAEVKQLYKLNAPNNVASMKEE